MHGVDSTITLNSGRKVGFAQYGDRTGVPILVMHGWPATRISSAIYHNRAKQLGVWIVAPDRPGFGLSDFEPERKLLDWPGDVEVIVDSLGIKQFAVLGVSGGAPSALSCAYRLPNRITRLGIVAGGGVGSNNVYWRTRAIAAMAGKAGLRNLIVSLMYFNSRYGIGVQAYRFLWGKEDKKLYKNQALVDRGNLTIADAFARGIDGPAWEMSLIAQDWGFDIAKITVPTFLWYGSEDHVVVRNSGKYFEETIPNCVLTQYAGEGHLISETHAQEIMQILAAA